MRWFPKFLTSLAIIGIATIAPLHGAQSENASRHHALSLIGTPKYAADFKHFDYVNPNAPKGGRVRIAAVGSYDSLNPISFKGVAALGIGLIYETLMYDSLQESSTSYGLIAEWAEYPADYSSVTFKLRKEARWHDGKPITPEDVIFSLEMIKKVNPRWAFYYKNITKAEKSGEHAVTFTFDTKGNRELPMITGQLTVLPKHYWTGTDKNGKQRDLSKTTLEAPLASGPYRIKKVDSGRSITYERVPDYWGKDLPVNIGHYNFDEIRFEYFRDTTVAFEAFKADRLDYHRETSSKNWATGYNVKSVKEGWIKRQKITLKTGQPMQSFALNLRRSKFTDPRIRRAFNLAFDFEWANKNLFFGQYRRVSSYFENSELAARDLPKGRELAILNEVKASLSPDQVNQFMPEEVFTKPYENPTNKSLQHTRRHLREAAQLLKQTGWKIKDRKLTNTRTGKVMSVEFLLVSPLFERIVQPYIRNLEKLGIKGSIRIVDSAQYSRRLDGFDFDIIVANFPQSQSPGNEQRDFWGSAAAEKNGSRNLIGIKSPAIDKLIDKIIFAKDRAELVAATRALDRVLLWNHYVVPQWFAPYERIAYWIRFGQPKTLPSLSVGFFQVWWYDKEAADKLTAIR
ncbi:oligopeptide-binding protein AppA [bacterium MnTg02]|nr:oligopeptide-binding protein AppA [bacterium MnTg02]